MRAANRLRVGAESDDSRNELGPFVHKRVSLIRISTGNWSAFAPTSPEDVSPIWHLLNRYISYFNPSGEPAGTMQMETYGENCSY